MTSDIRRLRPTRRTLAVLVGVLWAISFGAVRDFVWADLRTGMIDLRGLSRVTRGLILMGFALLFAMIGVLLFNDLWRTSFPLVPMLVGTPGRGALLPVALVPATLFLLALAWSFALVGALHSHPLVRLGVLLLYVFAAAQWTGAGAGFVTPAALWLGWGLLVVVPLFFVLRWRAQIRPVLEFAILLLLVAATFGIAQVRAVESWRLSAIPLVLASLTGNVLSLSSLILPLLMLIGVEIAGFTHRAAGWASEAATNRLPGWALRGLLLLVLVWRLRDVMLEALTGLAQSSLLQGLLAYAGALGIPVIVGLACWLITRWRRAAGDPSLDGEQVAQAVETHALPLILAYHALALVTFILLDFAATLPTAGFTLSQLGLAPGADSLAVALANQLSKSSDLFNLMMDPWHFLLEVLAMVAAIWLARRGRPALALYLGLFGAVTLWLEIARPGRPLARLTWHGSGPEDFWWVILFTLVAAVWLLRGRLTTERAGRLLFLLLITALLRQTDFIENPFSPFLAFAGIGFIAFGVVWDALTAGSWANVSTPGLPRISRIFLYLGYVLLTVTIINWALATHDLFTLGKFTGDTALVGLEIFGKPMIYAIFAVTLAPPLEAEEGGGASYVG
ncbi:MAG: hypothetical protein M5U01_17795 [Ardenticatenaceae bacterium]|nr:hypothetical protein [Ardenticatenaceae bacterium]